MIKPQQPPRETEESQHTGERPPASPPAGPADQREARLREQIDQNLRRAYRDMLEEPIPERFLALIAELRDTLKKP